MEKKLLIRLFWFNNCIVNACVLLWVLLCLRNPLESAFMCDQVNTLWIELTSDF